MTQLYLYRSILGHLCCRPVPFDTASGDSVYWLMVAAGSAEAVEAAMRLLKS